MRYLRFGSPFMLSRLRRAVTLLAGLMLVAAPAGAWTVDPTPPQLTADYIFSPSVLIQHDTYNLVYEMRLTNYAPSVSTFEAMPGRKVATHRGRNGHIVFCGASGVGSYLLVVTLAPLSD